MTRIFITGASGFVGGAATRHFVSQGHDVRAMSRSEKSDAAVQALGAAAIRCDLQNVAAANIDNAEAVVHCAAFVEQWGPKDAWKRFNVDGTARMLAAAKAAGVKRFIHISTESVLWRGHSLRNVDESYPLAPNSPYPYAATKAQAEQLVKAANAPGFETIILRPRFIWGPGDTTLMPTIEAMAKSGGWMWVNHGKAMTSTTHIANLIHAIALALSKGQSGEAYFILDDGARSMHDMISGMAAARGITLPEKSIPAWVADAMGGTCEALWGTFGLKGDPPLTRFSAMILSRDCLLNDQKARPRYGLSACDLGGRGDAGARGLTEPSPLGGVVRTANFRDPRCCNACSARSFAKDRSSSADRTAELTRPTVRAKRIVRSSSISAMARRSGRSCATQNSQWAKPTWTAASSSNAARFMTFLP